MPLIVPSSAVGAGWQYIPAGSGNTVPGAPTGVSATAGNTEATVSWTAPSDGGESITDYTVTPLIDSTLQTPISTGSTSTSFVVTGLTNGTTYTFVVKATNSIGTGSNSAQSNAVEPTTGETVPGQPTGVSGSAGNAEVVLSWTAPSDGGSVITGNTVTPYIGSTAQTTQTFGDVTSATVTGLTNGTAYTFTVIATNAIGNSIPSAASAAVTPTSGITPYAPVGWSSYNILLNEEFDGVTAPVAGQATNFSSSGLASGSGLLDQNMWTPWFSSFGVANGNYNNNSATFADNVWIGTYDGYSVVSLMLPSASSGACLFGGGSNTGTTLGDACDWNGKTGSESEGISGHLGMPPFTFGLIEFRAYFETGGSPAQNINWPCPVYCIGQGGVEFDMCEVNDYGGGSGDYDSFPGVSMINVHTTGDANDISYSLGVLSGWNIISVNWTSGSMAIYVNGELQTTLTGVDSAITGVIPITPIGGLGDGSNYYGGLPSTPSQMYIDWIHIFQEA